MAINGQTVLAVIPARGGSKRVPRKNLREYMGQSLIEWAWRAAKQSSLIDRAIVSTDDQEINDFAYAMGCIVVGRPAELATDEAKCEDVLRFYLGIKPHQWVVLLQPTSPLRTANDIDRCILLAQKPPHACVSYNATTLQKNGAVYVASAEWIAQYDFTHEEHHHYSMAAARSLDIDTEEDFAK